MAVKGGSATDRVYDATGGYIKLLIVVAVLFGVPLMHELNSLILNALFNVLGGLVNEVPDGATTIREIQAKP